MKSIILSALITVSTIFKVSAMDNFVENKDKKVPSAGELSLNPSDDVIIPLDRLGGSNEHLTIPDSENQLAYDNEETMYHLRRDHLYIGCCVSILMDVGAIGMGVVLGNYVGDSVGGVTGGILGGIMASVVGTKVA